MTGPSSRPVEKNAPVVNRENPWPGLAAFSEEQAGFFYGRDREVEDLFRRVRFNALSVLYGQSGLGKTSLVQAALFPRLRAVGIIPVWNRIDYSGAAPAARLQICQNIGEALKAAGGKAEPIGERESLWEYFHRKTPAVVDAGGKPLAVALAFDQFEELFVQGYDRGDGRGFAVDFIEELGSLSEDRPPGRVEAEFEHDPDRVAAYNFDRQDYRLLLALREDFLADLHDLGGRIPSITVNNMRLTPLNGVKALEVVERPGAGLVAPGAAEAIVRFVSDAGDDRREGPSRKEGDSLSKVMHRPIESIEIDPSLLSLFCRKLNEKRGSALITPGLVASSRERILAEFYEDCLSDQHPGVRRFVEDDLLTEKGFRQTLSLDSAEAKLQEYGASPAALDTLVDRRLLHFEQRGRLTRVELTHDVLNRVVRESRNERQAKEEAEEAERRAEAARRIAEREKADTEAQLVQIRKRQRVTRILLGVAAIAAGIALWGLARANVERTRSRAMLDQFCEYSLSLINKLGDSTARNSDLTSAYSLLIEQTDEAVHNMVTSSPATACPHQLRARTEIAATGNWDQLHETDSALVRAHEAARAAGELERFDDLRSRRILLQTYNDLVYRLWDLGDYPGAVEAGDHGVKVAATLPESLAQEVSQRQSAIDHYASLSLIRIAAADTDAVRIRTAIARAGLLADSGLAANARAIQHDSSDVRLVVSKAQLLMTRGEVDTAQKDSTRALQDYRNAESLLVTLDSSVTTFYSMYWRLIGNRATALLAQRLRRLEASDSASDRAIRQESRYIDQYRQRKQPADIEDGYQWLVSTLFGKARNAALRNQPSAALAVIRTALDSARASQSIRDSLRLLATVSSSYGSAGDLFELIGRRDSAERYYRNQVSADRNRLSLRTTLRIANDVDASLQTLVRVFRSRARADTAGKPVGEQVRILRASEDEVEDVRAEIVRNREEMLAMALRDGANGDAAEAHRTRLRDSVAEARGNLAYTQLLTGQAREAVATTGDSLASSEKYSFILPNRFNALVVNGERREATQFYTAHAADLVEDPAIPFPCAVVRDIRDLHWRGTATSEQVQFVERLAGAQVSKCQLPTLPGQ